MRMKQPAFVRSGMAVGMVAGLFALVLGAAPAHATFVNDTGLSNGLPLSQKYFLVAEKGSASFSGDVGGQSTGKIIDALANTTVDVANGWATIKPTKHALLTSIVFTPEDPNAWGDFSLRGQVLSTVSQLEITVQDNQGGLPQSFFYTIPHANADFSRIGIVSTDSETIQTVTITDLSGFKEVKQIGFSPCSPIVSGGCNGGGGGGGAVPEPASLLILGSGLLGLGVLRRRLR